jgi:translation initiation factor 5B
VPVTFEAEEQAKRDGVKIFSAMIIYHLFDAFKKHMEEVREARMKEAAPQAVWPCRLKILRPFASKDPIILGCDIIAGATCRVGTPVGVVRHDKETGKREIIPLGKITGLEINHKPMQIVKKSQVGAGVAVKIERAAHQASKSFGRHFDEKDEVVSLISRKSLDVLSKWLPFSALFPLTGRNYLPRQGRDVRLGTP